MTSRRAPHGRPVAAALLLLAVGATGPTAPAVAQSTVTVHPVTAAPVRETLTLPGTIVAPRTSDLSPQVEGHVEAVLVEAGEAVTAGQPLLRLDAVLGRLDLQRLRHALAEAQAAHGDSRRRAEDAESLVSTQSISRTEARSRAAQAAIDAARVKQLEASVAMQEEVVARHTLTAPFAGAITRRAAERGQYVETSTPVLRLEAIDRLRVEVAVPERYARRIAAGQPVTVAPGDAGTPPRAARIGRIGRIVPSADPVARTFVVQIPLTNAGHALMPGMSAEVRMPLQRLDQETAKRVPVEAVDHHADGSARVWIVRPAADGGVARRVTVRIGAQADGQIEILSPDIRADDVVVVRGGDGLRDGQSVTLDRLG